MAKRKKNPWTARDRKPVRGFFWILLGILIVLLGALLLARILQSERGRLWIALHLQDGEPAILAPLVDRNLLAAFHGLGVGEAAIAREREGEDRGLFRSVWKATLPDSISLVEANLAITRALRRMGGGVPEGTEKDGALTLTATVGPALRYRFELAGPKTEVKKAKPAALLALILDDFGLGGPTSVEPGFYDISFPLTVAILPTGREIAAVADSAKAAGFEILLQIPMEPKGYPTVSAGPGSILVDLPGKEIRKRVRKFAELLPGAAGASGHMGSLATQDRDVMRAVLEELRREDFYFVDHLTSPHSVVASVAAEVGVSALEVDYPGQTDWPGATRRQVEAGIGRLAALARNRGYAVGSLRPRPETLEALRRTLPGLEATGVRVVPASAVSRRTRSAGVG
jgi:polysaccharide deacetylase 2 family uncharacterized protein YibQ